MPTPEELEVATKPTETNVDQTTTTTPKKVSKSKLVKGKLADGTTFEDQVRIAAEKATDGGKRPSSLSKPESSAESEIKPTVESEIKSSETPTLTKKNYKDNAVYAEAWNSLDEDLRTELMARSESYKNQMVDKYTTEMNAKLQEELGDLYDSKFIQALAKNKSLHKKLRKLDDEGLQQWFDIAYDQWESTKSGPGEEPGTTVQSLPKEVQEQLAEVAELKKRLDSQETSKRQESENAAAAQRQQEYQQHRNKDLDAFFTTHPEMRFKTADVSDPNYATMVDIHKLAEFEGTQQNRYVSYKEAFDKYSKIYQGRTPAPAAIPSTTDNSLGTTPQRPQDPKSKADAKNRFLKENKDFGALAETIAASRN